MELAGGEAAINRTTLSTFTSQASWPLASISGNVQVCVCVCLSPQKKFFNGVECRQRPKSLTYVDDDDNDKDNGKDDYNKENPYKDNYNKDDKTNWAYIFDDFRFFCQWLRG